MNKYKAQGYTDAKNRTLWGVTMMDGQVWAIEPRWSQARAEGMAQVLNDNPDMEPYDLEVEE